MSTKLSKEDTALSNKEASHPLMNAKGEKRQLLSLISESVLKQYRTGLKHSKLQSNPIYEYNLIGNGNHKSIYESLIVKSNLVTTPIIQQVKAASPEHRHKSNSNKSNKLQHTNTNATMTRENSHKKKNRKPSVTLNPLPHSKEKVQRVTLMKTELFKKVSQGKGYLSMAKPFNLASVGKKVVVNEVKHKKEAHHQPTRTVVDMSSILSKKNPCNNSISHSNSISIFDKTSTEATTTSKRLNDNNKHKLPINATKAMLKPNFNKGNCASLYSKAFISSHESDPKHTKNSKQLAYSVSLENHSESNWHKACNTIDNYHLRGLINNPLRHPLKNKKSKSFSMDPTTKEESSKKHQNDFGSLSFLSEYSAFDSGNRKSNSLSQTNNPQEQSSLNKTGSLKNARNNCFKNIETKSKQTLSYYPPSGLSKEKSSQSGEGTVSFTYSDDEAEPKGARRPLRINDEDFLKFYTETHNKLFGCSK